MRPTYEKTAAAHVFRYASLADFIETAEAAKAHAESKKPENVSRAVDTLSDCTKGACWFGVPHSELKRAITVTGWPAGVEQINKALADLAAPTAPTSQKRRRTRGDFGDSIDMQAVYAGRIDSAWTRCARRETTGPRRVRLVASLAGSGSTDQSVFFARGAACIKLADLLTQAGYAVEIVGDYTLQDAYTQAKKDLTQRVLLKDAHQPLDLAALTACVALAGFKRWYGFLAATWCCSELRKVQRYVIGRSTEAHQLDADDITGFAGIDDLDSARRFVAATIARLESPTA